MPRDPRLYMTFPIDFDEHPKVEPLSDAAFRVFVQMNGYCRRQRTDGLITGVVARRRWSARALNELVSSHEERPLVVRDGDDYRIRDYAEHQFTTADEQELHDRKAAAGSAGGKAKAAAIAAAKQESKQTPKQDLAGSGSGSGIPTDVTNFDPVSYEAIARDERLTDFIRGECERVGVSDVSDLRLTVAKALHRPVSLRATVRLAEEIAKRASKPVRNVDAYLATACRGDVDEVLWQFDRLDLGADS